jgi:REP element-mobilizing transposase RayT
MKYDPKIHHRHSIRLKDYDYAQAGAYYITVVAHRRERLFGEVVDREMRLNRLGRILNHAWMDLPNHYPYAELDVFVVMPNHVHGIVVFTDDGHHPVSEVVRAFKSFSARRINSLRRTAGLPVWQRNYYEHVIRDQKDLEARRVYILSNPLNWADDSENMEA